MVSRAAALHPRSPYPPPPPPPTTHTHPMILLQIWQMGEHVWAD